MGTRTCVVLLVLYITLTLAQDDWCDPETCIVAKNCRCAFNGPKVPGGFFNKVDIPQFVAFTFQGPIKRDSYDTIRGIFSGDKRKNKDGCSYKATFFVPGQYNEWSFVKSLHDTGHEIGAYSNSFKQSHDYWQKITVDHIREETIGVLDKLESDAKIPREQIRGWRSPSFIFGGDIMMSGIYKAGFTYDASLRVNSEYKIWPFTLDAGWPFRKTCGVYSDACFKYNYTGMWEVPAILHSYSNRETVSFDIVSGHDDKELYNTLKKNFDLYYRDTKAPFIVTFTASYFTNPETKGARLAAINKFIDYLNGQSDVFIKPLHEIIEWIKEPKAVEKMTDCKNKENTEKDEPPPFDVKKLSRYETFLYLYSVNYSSAPFMRYTVLTVLLPILALVKYYL